MRNAMMGSCHDGFEAKAVHGRRRDACSRSGYLRSIKNKEACDSYCLCHLKHMLRNPTLSLQNNKMPFFPKENVIPD